MFCDLGPNWCISNLIFACLSGLIFLISSYQTFEYFRSPRYITKTLKGIIIATNLLNLFLSLHFLLIDAKYEIILVFAEFLLYFDFCLIAMFFLFQSSKYLEDSGVLVKFAKYLLLSIFGLLIILFSYFLVVVSMHTLNYNDCTSIEWAAAKYTSFFIGCAFFGVGLKISLKLRQKKKQGLAVMDNRENELW